MENFSYKKLKFSQLRTQSEPKQKKKKKVTMPSRYSPPFLLHLNDIFTLQTKIIDLPTISTCYFPAWMLTGMQEIQVFYNVWFSLIIYRIRRGQFLGTSLTTCKSAEAHLFKMSSVLPSEIKAGLRRIDNHVLLLP